MIRAVIFLVALLLAIPATAHQQKVAISTLSHNPRSGMLEIVHRVPLHDAEHALKTQGLRAPDILKDTKSRRAFARYLEQRFAVSHNGAKIALALVGSEISGGNLMVYQEGPSPAPGALIKVQSQILTDVWPRQENRVNIGNGTKVETLIFRDADRAKGAVLP